MVPGVAAFYRNQSQTHGCNIGRFYEFDWEDVYSLERKMPQGCTCAAGGISKSNCKVFDCGCTCDLTAGACDYNCCCDPDCTDAEVSRFEASEAGCILHEEVPDFQKCYNAEGVNERYPMAYMGTAKESIDQLLCVAVDNSDVKGDYFEDPGMYEDDSTVFDDDRGQKTFAYTDVIPGASSDRGSSTAYYRGDPMRAATEDAGPRAAFGGFLPMPTAGPDGQCTEQNYAHFKEPVRENSCVRVVEDLGESCEREFDARRFTELSVCRSFQTSFDGCGEDWVDIELGTVTYRSGNGAETKSRDLTVAPESQYFNWDLDHLVNKTGKSSNYGKNGMRKADNRTHYLDAFWNTTFLGFCMNAVTEVCYYVFHGPGGAIDKIMVDVTVANVTTATPPRATFVHQEFQMEFVPTKPHRWKADPQTYGNSIMRGRSGNPGYIVGLPLLNGELETYGAKEAIHARVPGLKAFGSSTSAKCDPSADIPENSQAVNFGEDIVTGCILELSYQNFSAFCGQTNEHMRDTGVSGISSKVPKYIWINSSFTYIGIYGNADPLDTSQWMRMDIEANSNTPTFDSNDRLCTDMPTSLHYEFLYAYVGSTQNPQAKVVGARAYYGY
jgi:hypothetical protein